MEPMRVIWAGLVVIVQAPAPRPGAAPPGSPQPGPWGGPAADHDIVLHQVSAWLSGLRHGVQAAPPLPAFPVVPPQARPEPARDEPETPLPGFYL
jgi:hypothetical protein